MADKLRKLSTQISGPIRTYSHAVGIKPRRWSSVPIWICGAVIMLGLTVNDLCPVISDYFDDDANVNVQITVARQEPSRNPQLFFCIPIPSLSANSHFGKLKRKLITGGNCTECTELENRSWDVWSTMDRNSTTFLLDLFHAFAVKILADNLTEIIRSESVSTNSQRDWRKPLIDIAWITISRMSKLDAAFRNGTLQRGRWYTIESHHGLNRSDNHNRSVSVSYHQKHSENRSAFDHGNRSVSGHQVDHEDHFKLNLHNDSQNRAMMLLNPQIGFGNRSHSLAHQNQIDQQNLSLSDLTNQTQSSDQIEQIDDLFQGLIEFVCNFIEIYSSNASDPMGNCSDTNCLQGCIDMLNVSGAIRGSDNTFCFELPSTDSKFQLSLKEQFFDYLVARKPFSIYFENPVFSENAELIYRSPIPDGGQVSMRKQENIKLRYSIVNKVIEERVGKNPFKDRSQIDCLTKCRNYLMVKSCQCIPFIGRGFGNGNGTDYCSIDSYENCSGKIDSSSCEDRCATAQEHTTYQWTIDRTAINSVKPGFTLDVASLMRPYLEFNMTYRDSKSKLVSQIGGVFNFYLGWSGLSIIVFSIYCINAYAFYRSKKREDLQTRETWMKVLWQWKWTQLAGQVAQQDLQTNGNHSSNGEIRELKAMIEELRNEMRVEMRMLRNEPVMNGIHERREEEHEVDCTAV